MRLLKLAFRRETAMPMLALTFASGVCLILISARIIWTGKLRYGFLLWNLFLAWLPLLFPLLACEKYHNASGRNWRFLGLAGAWLLFFPNAPYIFTDLIHLTRGYFPHFWVDMVLILTCALTGLVLGFLSLFLMQSIVSRMFGRTASWVFIATVAGLSGIGMYLGRSNASTVGTSSSNPWRCLAVSRIGPPIRLGTLAPLRCRRFSPPS